MWNKRKWYSILLMGLVLLLVSSFIGCGQSQSEAYQEGYKAGYTEGYDDGEDKGYDRGFAAGLLAQKESDEIRPSNGTDGEDGEEKELPSGAIWWYEAKDHIGDRATVCGTVAGTKYGATSNGRPTWLNIGNDYPSAERFVVIIWGENRGNFPQPPESYYDGKTICVTGLITEYKGIPQIEVTTPDQIQEQ